MCSNSMAVNPARAPHYRAMRTAERCKLEQLLADARAAASSTIMPREVGERSTEHFVIVGDHTPEPRARFESDRV